DRFVPVVIARLNPPRLSRTDQGYTLDADHHVRLSREVEFVNLYFSARVVVGVSRRRSYNTVTIYVLLGGESIVSIIDVPHLTINCTFRVKDPRHQQVAGIGVIVHGAPIRPVRVSVNLLDYLILLIESDRIAERGLFNDLPVLLLELR